MTRAYRTWIEVAGDRHATLQLPPDFPAGRAWIVVEAGAEPAAVAVEADEPLAGEADDIEWWDELGESGEIDGELARRAGSLALDG